MARAIELTAKPTLAAAVAAAIAYGSLALTAFRGFRQFGEVGGVGMILCWAATYIYCPALIHLTERLFHGRPRGHTMSSGSLTTAAAVLLRNPRPVMTVVVGVTALAAWTLAPVLRSPFEYDFSEAAEPAQPQAGGRRPLRSGRPNLPAGSRASWRRDPA